MLLARSTHSVAAAAARRRTSSALATIAASMSKREAASAAAGQAKRARAAKSPPIVYTWTDEAPALATYSFLPVVRAFAAATGVPVETRDISLSGRILAAFADRVAVPAGTAVTDDLAELGRMVETPAANIIKLPNISASVPQIKACIAELRAKGFDLPDFPDKPRTDAERDVRDRYNTAKGSAVNPVLRMGNSDRRAPPAVKAFAHKNPPRMMDWDKASKSHVSTMDAGDFCHNERSVTVADATSVRIEHVAAADGTTTVLKPDVPLQAGEIIDSTYMSRRALVDFLAREIADAKAKGVLFSIHLKATMMKVSDPIIFGHAVRVFFARVFERHGEALAAAGANPNNGFGDVLDKVAAMPAAERKAVEETIAECYADGPALAMVNSAKGITNLHVPSDVIIDASMPPMVRDAGRMWNKDDKLQDTKAVIPDSSYAGVYDAVVRDCQEHGRLDPGTMGSVPNVGLMAMKAEEYGSHDKTFEIPTDGTVRVVDASGAVIMEHHVEAGDIWRACQVKDEPIRDWVRLAVERARATGAPAIFWLDAARAHDAQVARKVEAYLKDHDTAGLDVRIMSPVDATRLSLERIRRGEDTISVTGNVLRDYLTDLFPILEIGTSARMLSIVPLLKGGGLFETGAGGSAPKHVEQFEKEGHLRWDSLGEYMALAASLQHLGSKFSNAEARVLGDALDEATADYLTNKREPSRKVNELDNRGSTFYLTMYWARALAKQTEAPELAKSFARVAEALERNEGVIVDELNASQGAAQDVGGYFRPSPELAYKAMRPSATFNSVIDGMLGDGQAKL